MKHLDMMHYFLGMEVWHNADGISLGQWKYVVEILKRFKMMDCKAMTTPIESNLKLLSDASSELVDATMYFQMIGSLMYLVNTRLDIFLLWMLSVGSCVNRGRFIQLVQNMYSDTYVALWDMIYDMTQIVN